MSEEETIAVCVFCEDECIWHNYDGVVAYNLFCKDCDSKKGVIMVKAVDWFNDELTFEQLKERAV